MTCDSERRVRIRHTSQDLRFPSRPGPLLELPGKRRRLVGFSGVLCFGALREGTGHTNSLCSLRLMALTFCLGNGRPETCSRTEGTSAFLAGVGRAEVRDKSATALCLSS